MAQVSAKNKLELSNKIYYTFKSLSDTLMAPNCEQFICFKFCCSFLAPVTIPVSAGVNYPCWYGNICNMIPLSASKALEDDISFFSGRYV